MNSHCEICNKVLQTESDHGLCRYCILYQTIEPSTDLEYFPESIGGYKLEKQIGRGGMGVVFSAIQPDLNRQVAVKIVLDGQLAGKEDKLRFLKEIELTAQLDHPSIIPIYDSGEDSGYLYYSAKLINTGSLQDFLLKRKSANQSTIEDRKIAEIISKISSAIQHGHSRGIIHRDIKPSNILIDENEHPYLSDFGLAKRDQNAKNYTKTAHLVGTPHYLAPEQLLSNSVATSVDIYAIGVVMYELLTLNPPFYDKSIPKIFEAILHQSPKISKQNNNSRFLWAICLKCLNKSPDKRYLTALELAKDLHRFLENKPVLACPPSRLFKLWMFAKRHPVSVVLSILMTTLIFSFIWLMFDTAKTAKEATQKARQSEQEAARKEVKSRHGKAALLIQQANTELTKDQIRSGLNLLLQAAEISHDNPQNKRLALRLLSAWSTYSPRYIQHSNRGSVAIRVCENKDSFCFASYRPNKHCLIWNTKDTISLKHKWTHRSIVNDCCFSSDGKLAATISYTEARLYNLESGEMILEIPHPSRTHSEPHSDKSSSRIVFSHDESRLLIAFANHSLIQLDLGSGKATPIDASTNHSSDKQLRYVEINQTASTTVVAYVHGVEVTRKKEAPIFFESEGLTYDIEISPNEKYLAIADGGYSVHLYSLPSLKQIAELPHKYKTTGVAFNSDSNKLITTSRDRSSKVWSLSDNEYPSLISTQRYLSACLTAKWLKNEDAFATATENGTLHFYSVPYVHPYLNYSPLDGITTDLSVTSNQLDNVRVILANHLGGASIHANFEVPQSKLESKTLIRKMNFHKKTGQIIALSDFFPNKQTVSAVNMEGEGDVKLIKNLQCETTSKAASLSSNGNWHAAGKNDGSVEITNVLTNDLYKTPKLSNSPILSTVINGNILVCYDSSMTITTFDLLKKRVLKNRKLKYDMATMSMSPDGQLLALTFGRGLLHLYSIPNLDRVAFNEKPLHTNTILTISFSPDSRKICTGGMDKVARLWNVKTGEQIGKDLLHKDYVWEIAFNENGNILATAGLERCVRFWDATTGYQLGAQLPHPQSVNGMCFTMDKKGKEYLVTAANDKIIRSVPLPKQHIKTLQQWSQWLRERKVEH